MGVMALKRCTVSLLALIALVALTSWGGAGYAATLNVKLTAPYDYATAYTKASHDCWLVFEFAFSGPELPMASVQAVVLTEQTSDHDLVQTLTPAQVQWTPYPPPPPRRTQRLPICQSTGLQVTLSPNCG